ACHPDAKRRISPPRTSLAQHRPPNSTPTPTPGALMTLEPTTLDFHGIARTNEIPEGALLGATVGAQQVVLGRFQGQLYALDGACSHQGAPLCEGDLDGPVLSCPLHNGAVDMRTGAPERLPVDTPIARYAVREVDGSA